MKKLILILTLCISIVACKNEKETTQVEVEETKPELAYTSIGMEIDDENVLSAKEMMDTYHTMKPGDTLNTKLKAEIIEVCSKKGCWMTLDMENEKEVMVKFKDYGFFMPLDADGEVIINGKAFVAETPIEELKHYAEDAGKSKEEIEAITEPKLEYKFEADGVLLKE